MPEAGRASVKFVGDYSALMAGLTSTLGGSKLKSVGLKAGGALAAGFVASKAVDELMKAVNVTKEFDKQISSLGAVAGASNKQMEALRKQAIKMGADTVFSATEAAQAQTELAKGGLNASQILGGALKSSLDLAAAGELDLADAAETTVNAMQLFGLAGRDTSKIADMLATAANKTTADVLDFAMSLKQGGAVAKTAGYSLNDTVVVLEALAEAGIKNSDAGTSMKAALIQLLNPTKKQAELAEKLHISWLSQNGELKTAVGISRQLKTATEGMSKAERTKTLAILAGTDGFRTLSALYDAGVGKLRAYAKANQEQGTAAEDAARKTDNLAGDTEQLSGAYQTLQITVGTALTPVLRKATQAATDLTEGLTALATGDFNGWLDRLSKRSQTASDAIDALRASWKILGPAMGATVEFVRTKFSSMIDGLRGVLKVFKGVVTAVSGLLHGDWRRAWDGAKMTVSGAVGVVKATVKGMVAPLRATFNGVRRLMSNVFGGAWRSVESIFAKGANAVIDVVNAIISVLNKIPGVEIGKVGNIGVNLDYLSKDPNGKSLGRQRGGVMFGGKPSGDSIPAMLERGEYVLNRKAVQQVGVENLNRLNFDHAARFQQGGPIGLIGGGIADAVGGAASSVAGAASNLAGKALGVGAGWFIHRLPKPDLPAPFAGVGPWLIDHVTDWIKGKVPGLGGSLGTLPGDLGKAMALAQQHGLTITSTTGGTHAPGSYHYMGRAFDASNGTNTPEERAYFLDAASRWGSKILELFYDPIGWYIKNGSKVPGAIGGHSDHVHTAMQLGGLVPVQGFYTGGQVGVYRGKVTWFNGGATAGGSDTSKPGLALNLNPGSDSGWNNSKTQKWMTASRAGRPYYADVGIGGKSAILPLTDLGPAGWTHNMIDVTEGGVSKLGFSTGNFPSGTEGVAWLLGQNPRPRKGSPSWTGGAGASGMSAAEKAKAASKSRRESREKLVRSLIGKGQFWRVFDLFARFGDFESGVSKYGGVGPDQSEAYQFLSRVGAAAGSGNPNRRQDRLGSVARWLLGAVDLTGSEDGNEGLAARLKKVQEKAQKVAGKRRSRKMDRLARFGEDSPWGKRLNKNASWIELLTERIGNAEREHGAPWSAGGSEYTDAEVANEVGLNRRKLTAENRRYRMFTAAIPYFTAAADRYRKLIDRAGPKDRWKVPGWRKGLRGATANLKAARSGLNSLVGLTGDGGTRGDTYFRLRELGFTDTVEKVAAATANAGISIGDLRGIVDFAALGGYRDMPILHRGGIYRAAPGQTEGPALLQDGETVRTKEQERALRSGNVTFQVKFRDDRLKDLIEITMDDRDREVDQHMKAAGV